MRLQILPVRRRPLGLMLGALLGAFAFCAGRPSPSAPAGLTVRNSASVQLVSYSDVGGIEEVSPLVPADEPEWGAGSGRGEFRAVASVCALPSGHLVAFDQVQRRAIAFDTLGTALEQRSVVVPPAESEAFRLDDVRGVATDGDVLVTASRPGSQADTALDVTLRRFGRGTEAAWRLAAPDAGAEASSRVLPGGALTLVPFARQPLAAVCGDDLVLADAQSLRVQRLAPDASLRVQTESAVAPRQATDAGIRDLLAAGMPTGESVPDEQMALTRSLRSSVRFPELDRVLCDAQGKAWLMRRPRAGADHRLLLPVEANGNAGRPIRLPTAWRLLAVHAGRVVAVSVGEDGAESVGVWRVAGEPGSR